MDPDLLLIQKIKQGDGAAIEEFVRKYYPAVLKYCRVRIDDAGYAEDAAQETFERFFRSFDRYRHCGKAANFLYAVAGNVCRDYYRKRREYAAGSAEEVLTRERRIRETGLTEEAFETEAQGGGGPEAAGNSRSQADWQRNAGPPPDCSVRGEWPDPELRLDLREAFSRLPEELYETAVLYFCQEQKQREIAKILGIGLPLVKYRIKKAREILIKWLSEGE